MQLVEAAAGLCDLLWMVDRSLPDMDETAELLNRFGPVVDVSGLGVEEITKALSPYAPDGIATYLDAGMVGYAEVAAILGLPFHSPGTARVLVDKARQRQALAAGGIVVPPCRAIPADRSTSELAPTLSSIEAEVGWPAILKPISAQGSRYTFLARDHDDLIRLLDALGSARPEMVLEGYLADDPEWGDEDLAGYVSVESVVAGGVISHLALTGRFQLAANFRETGFFIPAALSAADQTDVLDLATAAIEALGVEVGCLHTEVKFTPEGLRVIEVNGRVGGGVPEMIERAAGIHLLELTLRLALGEQIRIDGPVGTDRIGFRFFLQPPAISATVATIEGLDEVSDHPAVDTISVHQGPGAELDWKDGSRTHILAVVGTAASDDELRALYRLLHDAVTVTYADVRVA